MCVRMLVVVGVAGRMQPSRIETRGVRCSAVPVIPAVKREMGATYPAEVSDGAVLFCRFPLRWANSRSGSSCDNRIVCAGLAAAAALAGGRRFRHSFPGFPGLPFVLPGILLDTDAVRADWRPSRGEGRRDRSWTGATKPVGIAGKTK